MTLMAMEFFSKIGHEKLKTAKGYIHDTIPRSQFSRTL